MKKLLLLFTFISFASLTAFGQITTFPHTEGFENGGTIPTDWTQEYVSSTNDWRFQGNNQNSSISSRTGSYMATFYGINYSDVTKLVSPALDLSGLTNGAKVTFYHTQVNWFGDIDELRVYYKTSVGGAWVQLAAYTAAVTTWTEVTLTLPSPSADYYIAFEGRESYARGVTVDDITIEELPSCVTLTTSLSSGSCTGTSAAIVIDVTDLGDGADYTVTNDIDATTATISAGGVQADYGSFAEGTAVTLTYTAVGDPACATTTASYTMPTCPPVNDMCMGAIDIPVTAGTCGAMTVGNNTGSTNSNSDPNTPAATCTSFAGGDIWFKITVPASGNVTISGDASPGCCSYLWYEVYSGADCTALTNVQCSSTTGNNPSLFEMALTGRTGGETLWVRAWDSSNDDGPGDFNFCAYEPCGIVSIVAGAQTACVPATNEYTQEVTVTYAVGSGDLDVNGQTFTATGSPQLVTLVGLTSDGTAVDVTASFPAAGTCTATELALFTAQASCTVSCGILSITDGGNAMCDISGGTYSTDVIVNYVNPPASGTLDVTAGGITVNAAITTSPQTVTIPGLTTGSIPEDVTATFSAEPTCTLMSSAVFTPIADCSPGTCGIPIALTADVACVAGDTDLHGNTLPFSFCGGSYGDGDDDAVYSFTPAADGDFNLTVSAIDATYAGVFVFTGSCPADGATSCDYQAVNANSSADLAIEDMPLIGGTTYYMIVTTWGSPYDVGFCIGLTESTSCDISAITAGTQTACNPADNTYTQEVTVTFVDAPASGTLDVNGQSFAIGTSPQTVTLTGLASSGASVDVTAIFSDDVTCDLSSTGLFTAPAFCGPGECANPIVLTEGADCLAGDTDIFGNTMAFSFCGTSYGDGDDDAVYSFTPAATAHYDLTVSAIDATYAGVFVFEGACPVDGSTACDFNAVNTGSTSNLVVSAMELTGGTTYYIVVTTWGSPYDVGFCIEIDGVSPNDDCGTAININGGGVAGVATGTPMTANTAFSGASPTGASSCAPGNSDDDIWFVFTANPEGGLATINVVGAGSFSPGIELFVPTSGTNCTGGLTALEICGTTTAGVTLSADQVCYVRVYDIGAGLIDGSADERAAGGFTIAASGAALPAELTSFTGKAMDKYNTLKWETATEFNTSEFAIERSLDGRNNWELVGTERAAGNSDANLTYSFDDMRPVSQAYYRLHTIDLDGTSQVSNIVSIKRDATGFDVILVAPNPTTAKTVVTFESLKDARVDAMVTDITGKVISTLTQDAIGGLNSMTIDLSNAPSGVYFLTMNNGVSNITRRIVKH
jgi:hypothetical protein